MSKILIANWKLHPETEAEAVKLAKATDASSVVVCPPFPFIPAVRKALKQAAVGAQDLFWEESGPFTGEVSATELTGLKVSHVIIGHSERRQALAETDEMVAKKVAAAISQGLSPILCIGETRTERDGQRTREVIDRQLRSALSLIPADIGEVKPRVYIAYEPIWAISTNQELGKAVTATAADVQNVVHYLQGITRGAPIEPVFLYGGSVDSENLGLFLVLPEIAGALVGGASLRAAEFKKMIAIASRLQSS